LEYAAECKRFPRLSMGLSWSAIRGIPHVSAPCVGTKRPRSYTVTRNSPCEREDKRLRTNLTHEFTSAATIASAAISRPAPASPTTLSKPVAPLMDVTPDGEMHKFKVRCPAMYWGNKKDVAKVLGRVPNFPPFSSMQKLSTWEHFFVTFPNAATAAAGTAMLEQILHKGDAWVAVKAPELSAKRARIDDAIERGGNGRDEKICRTASDVTAPWREVKYEQQIQRKRQVALKALSAVTRQMREQRFQPGALPWLDALQSGGMNASRSAKAPPCCTLTDFVTTDEGEAFGRTYYRNKNEFTVGHSPSSCGISEHTYHVSEPTVGFSLGLMRNGESRVSGITEECVTTSRISLAVAGAMEDVVRRSKQPPFDKLSHSGYWRQIMCRHSDRTGTVLVVPMVCHTPLEGAALARDIWSDKECRVQVAVALNALFSGSKYKWGLYWQTNSNMSAPTSDTDMEWVSGEKNLTEQLLGLTFRVHPSAFFQVNTVMAEKLYTSIGQAGKLQPQSILLDICCGTGTIGLSLSNRVQKVVGVEMCESAVIDARHNAYMNKVYNAVFIAGKVEDKIREVMSHVPPGSDCIAVLDPPRAGVHNSVVMALRSNSVVKRVVYVACEPNNLWRNALALCRPSSKQYGGLPFRPVNAIGLDLFPHTPCAELICVFER
jgi:tRNA (uracil-5-)-methyltransferase